MSPSDITPVPYRTVGELLGSGHTFEIPLNQRSLEWGFPKMLDVWIDLKDASEYGIQHFMGFMVFQTNGTPAKPIYTVQDGQQRLMCLVSIAGILYRLLQGRAPKVSQAQQAQLYNLFKGHNQHRLVLDRHHAHLSDLLETGKPGPHSGDERSSATTFTKAFGDLEKRIRSDLKPLKDRDLSAWVTNFISTLHGSVLVSAVSVRSPALALKIFYRLNSGGVSLSHSDITKNLAYLQAERDGVPDGDVTVRWDRLVDLVPFPSLTAFLRYWVEMKSGVVVRQADLVKRLGEYCERDVIGFLDELVASAESLDSWWNGRPGVNVSVSEALHLLGRPALAYPLLWTGDDLVSKKRITKTQRDELARAVEKYIFRELTVSGRKTNEIREHLVACASALRKNGTSAAIGVLSSKSPDPAFQAEFSSWVTRIKSKQFYVVREVERRLSQGQPTPGAGYVWTDNKSTRAWEIEHICPVKKSASLQGEVNRIGNLVLLEKALNQACKDKDFADKRAIYKGGRKGRRPLSPSKMAAVSGTSFPKGINYRSLTQMTRVSTFGDKQIVERQEQLADLALDIWRIA